MENFPRIMDVEFTAGMENNLDEIEEGRTDWRKILEQFYQPFSTDLTRAKEHMLSMKREGLKTDLKCEECGGGMVLKYGRNGPFLSCDRYPECKNALDFVRDENGKLTPVKQEIPETGEVCDKCGQPMVVKKGRYGPFLACSGYPDCKNTRPLDGGAGQETPPFPEHMDSKCEKCGAELTVKRSRQGGLFIACTNYPKCKNTKPFPIGVKCPNPKCDGELAERSSSRGVFYGCTNYPKCRFTLKTRPIAEKCPVCGAEYLVEAPTKDPEEKTVYKCPNKECDYTRTED